MTKADMKAFERAIGMLAQALPGRDVNPLMLEAYWRALNDLTIEQIGTATMKALREARFMPSPAELREFAGQAKPSDLAELAWESVLRAIRKHGAYASVRFEDHATAGAVRGLGGWIRLCDMPSEELHSYARHAFLIAYRAWSGRAGDAEIEEMPGLFAQDANGRAVRVRIKAPYLARPTTPRIDPPRFQIGEDGVA